MLRLLRYLKKRDYALIVGIIALTILQVYCMMTLMDYIQGITQAITYVNYHMQGVEGVFGPGSSVLYPDWDAVKNNVDALALMMAASNGQDVETIKGILLSIVNASSADIWWNAGMMILMALGLISCQGVISIMSANIASSMATRVRTELNNKISSFSLAEINKFSTESLVTRTTNDLQQFQFSLLWTFRMFFTAPTTAIWAIVKINAVSWKLMLPTILGILLLVIGMAVLLIFVMPKFKVTQRLIDRLNGITRENLSGIRVVHAYNAEDYQEDKFKKVNSDLTKMQLFTGRAMAIMSPFINLVMNGISVSVYWIGAIMINDPVETLTYAQILSFMMLSTQIVMSFMMLLMMFYMLPRASVCAKRIDEVLKTEPSIQDPEVEKETTEKGTLVFNHVSFRYPGADNDIIEDISFSMKQGETLAIVGETGSGKSTLVNLIARLYDTTRGEVLLDGVNVKDLKQSTIHNLVGFVPQRGLLFKGTVASNIAFGQSEPSQEKIEFASKIACADSFIQEMPEKYQAPIAQGGTNVSGGQKQRLCIARAIYSDPEFLVFDDSFSALDFKTDRQVRENLSQSKASKIIVAQRIGTIMDADHIVVLSEGKMVGYGKHKELLSTCPTYRDIALSQLSKEELGL